MASGLLRERDLRVLTAVVEDGLRDDPGEAMPWVVFDRLHDLVPCDRARFEEINMPGQEQVMTQDFAQGERLDTFFGDIPDPDPDIEAKFWASRAEFLPYRHQAPGADLVSVIRWSDFYTQSELKNSAFFADYLWNHGPHRYAILVPLACRMGKIRRLGLWRSNRDFSERERLALQLLRPHLQEVYLDAERRRRGIPHLSRREVEVLRLASQGFSNADIARTLFISPATVAKHMEHIFDRTGVRTRSAAAALALPQVSPFTVVPPKTSR